MTEPPRVLIVDDDPDIRVLLQLKLERSGWQVTTVASGEAALEAVDAQVPALIVIDLRMPGIGGRDCIRLLRERHVEAHIVAFSAFFGFEALDFPPAWNVIPVTKHDVATLYRVCRVLHDTITDPSCHAFSSGRS